jgi:hypothetical protein
MSIESILIVMLYSIKPYLYLIIFLALLPLGCYLVVLNSPLLTPKQTWAVSGLLGILIGLAAPYLTLSKLEYVTTYTDWATLIGIMLGAAIYCWIILTLLFKRNVGTRIA